MSCCGAAYAGDEEPERVRQRRVQTENRLGPDFDEGWPGDFPQEWVVAEHDLVVPVDEIIGEGGEKDDGREQRGEKSRKQATNERGREIDSRPRVRLRVWFQCSSLGLVVVSDVVEEAILVEDGNAEFFRFIHRRLVGIQLGLSIREALGVDRIFAFFLGVVREDRLFADDDEVGVDGEIGRDLAAPLGDEAFDGLGVLHRGQVVLVEVELAVDVEGIFGVAVVDEVGGRSRLR